jgi:hypothetical protein
VDNKDREIKRLKLQLEIAETVAERALATSTELIKYVKLIQNVN